MNNNVLEGLRDITLFPARMATAIVKGMGRLAIEMVGKFVVPSNEPNKDL